MIKKHDTWRRGWMFLAVLLCFAVSTTTLVRVRFVEAQTVEQPKKEEAVSKPAAPKPKETEEKSGDSFGGLTWFQAAGKIIAPEQVDFKKFQIRSVCHSVTEPGHSGTSSTKIEEDGSFSGNVWGDRDYAFFFHDPDLRWAAKPVFLPVDKEDPKDEVVIQLEKGSLIEATLVNRETGKPISGMTVWLTQKTEWKETRSALETFSNSELLRTDENGQIKHCVTPGDFRFTVDMPNFSWGDGERLYSLDFTVKKGEDAKPVLKIPPPFVGQVLDENGEPVADASISMHGTTGDFLYTSSDKGGFFKRRTAPKNSMIEISKYKGQNRRLRSVRWVKDELKDDELWKIELTEGQTVTGRLLDAATGEPLSNTLFFYQYENPDNPRQKDFLPNSTRTDAEGYFKAVGLATGLNYRFFFVPGRIREYNGGPYSPRVELAFLKTDKPGESVDLGDLKVDPKQAVADRREQETENLDKRIAKELSAVVNGEKQGGLVVLVSSEDDPFLKQITERRNEEPFSSFAITVVNRNEFPEGFLEAFSGDAENCLFLVSPPVGEKHPLPVSLSQLRGEKDSPWNVPKDDASNQDDWKKTPGMVNPKILRAFLDDYLKR